MKTHRWVLAVSLAVVLAVDAHGGGVPAGASIARAREALMKYYNVPSESRNVEVSGDGRAVTICTDDCERFEVGPNAGIGDLWDAIVLFKAFMSQTVIDDSFRDANADLARQVLSRRSTNACHGAQSQERSASCALTSLAKTSRLRMTRTVYDEGNKCESAWSFDHPQKLLNKSCSKVAPSSRR